jgi:photosystem II stability/assembly factor-like uncharacterized protein
MNFLLLIFIFALLPAPQWTVQTSGVTARLRGVSAVNEHIAWASGADSTVLRTTDGGATWKKITVTADKLDFRDIDAIDARTAYILSIGNGPASRIYKTIDAGATWTLQFKNEEPKAFFDAMSFWDATHGIVFGDSIDGKFCIMTTENGGKTWVRVPANALPPALENEGAFAASGTNIALFGEFHAWIGTGAGAKSRVLATTDRGRTWRVTDTPLAAGPSAGIFSIAFRDAMHGVVVGGDYTKENEAVDNLAVTSDGGFTWTLVTGLTGFRSVVAYVPGASDLPRPSGANSANAPTPTLVAVGPSGSDYSYDNGLTWKALDGPGFDTLSFVPRSFPRGGGVRARPIAFAAGARGSIGRLVGP